MKNLKTKLFATLLCLSSLTALAADGDNQDASRILPGSTLEFTAPFIIPFPQPTQMSGDWQIIEIGKANGMRCYFQLAGALQPKKKAQFLEAGTTKIITNTLTPPKGARANYNKRGWDAYFTGNEWVSFHLRSDGQFALTCYESNHETKAWNRSMPSIGDVKTILQSAGIVLQLSARTTEDLDRATF